MEEMSADTGPASQRPAMIEDYSELSRQILRFANLGTLRVEFFREISRLLLEFTGCDMVEMRLKERGRHFLTGAAKGEELSFRFDVIPGVDNGPSRIFPGPDSSGNLERLYYHILKGDYSGRLRLTKKGTFFTGDTTIPAILPVKEGDSSAEGRLQLDAEFSSLVVVPFPINGANNSLMILKSKEKDFFTRDDVHALEGVAQNLGVALVHRHAQVALRERVKELTCLYGIAKVVAQPDIALPEILQKVVEFLPPAWLYPEIASARIIVDGRPYLAPGFQEGPHRLSSDIRVKGVRRGIVEVVYTRDTPSLDEGAFLREERILIDTVAGEIALILERRQAEEDRVRLQEQLRHADRLATIGQLAAGVAHELNEPLGGILGFAQLSRKTPGLPEEVEQDLQKIVNASLHAREVIKKLMVFARQMPPRKMSVNLNQVVEDGLYFLESRCAKAGIELVRNFGSGLPQIVADPSQLHQVLVNLVVNSIQAMPHGGKLTIQTESRNGKVILVVADTGMGMTPEVLGKIFVPFFTTKDVNEGTGLGLPVVHGIIVAHGGTINVESKTGQGTKFEIILPAGNPDIILNESEENGPEKR